MPTCLKITCLWNMLGLMKIEMGLMEVLGLITRPTSYNRPKVIWINMTFNQT